MDIIEAIERIDEYAKGLAYPEFMQDKRPRMRLSKARNSLPSMISWLLSWRGSSDDGPNFVTIDCLPMEVLDEDQSL